MAAKYDHINKKIQFSVLESNLDLHTAVSFKTFIHSDAELRGKRNRELSLKSAEEFLKFLYFAGRLQIIFSINCGAMDAIYCQAGL